MTITPTTSPGTITRTGPTTRQVRVSAFTVELGDTFELAEGEEIIGTQLLPQQRWGDTPRVQVFYLVNS